MDMLVAPPEAKPHGAPLMTEQLSPELSVAMTLQACGRGEADISCDFTTSTSTSPVLDSSKSSLSTGGLTSEKSKPQSETEELATLREELAKLFASKAEQAGDNRCETLPDSATTSLLERGLFALERVWASEGS